MAQPTTDTLVDDLAKQARAVRAADKRLRAQRAALDTLILQGMEADPPLTWKTLQQLTDLTPATLNAARLRALQRRADRP